MPKRILVVEDDLPLTQAIANYLARQGFLVDSASEREEAEALMTYVDYELVITDLSLTPFGCDGFDVMEFTWNRTPRPKVIVLTGREDPAIKYEAQFRGVDAFLTKPQSLERLNQVVQSVVGCGAAL